LYRGLDLLKLDKNSTDLQGFIFQFGGMELCLGGLNPPKPPVATGLLVTSQLPIPTKNLSIVFYVHLCPAL